MLGVAAAELESDAAKDGRQQHDEKGRLEKEAVSSS
jgi:hypothetical protein